MNVFVFISILIYQSFEKCPLLPYGYDKYQFFSKNKK